jgi:hypothetical protein
VRPPELRIEGCLIKTSYGTGGKVLRVEGPYPPDPEWYARLRLGGYTIVYEPLDGRGGPCWINEVFVEDGRIFAHPWRDEITVVGVVGSAQLALF